MISYKKCLKDTITSNIGKDNLKPTKKLDCTYYNLTLSGFSFAAPLLTHAKQVIILLSNTIS